MQRYYLMKKGVKNVFHLDFFLNHNDPSPGLWILENVDEDKINYKFLES